MGALRGTPVFKEKPQAARCIFMPGEGFWGGERRDVLGAERERGGGSCATGRISSSGRDEQHVGLNKE